MSSVLDALTSEQAEYVEAIVHRRGLERELTVRMLERLLRAGLVRTIPVGQPVAGAEFSVSVPGGAVWEIIAVAGTLVTSAVVANRRPVLTVADQDGNKSARMPVNANETAGTVWTNTWTDTVAAWTTAVGSAVSAPIPIGYAQAGWTIASSTAGLDAGDQWSAVMVTVVELSPLAIVRECRQLLDDLDSAGGIRYGAVR